MTPVELADAAAVLTATGHDPYARGALRTGYHVHGWQVPGAVAWHGVDQEERRSYLSALGDPQTAMTLVTAVAGDGQRVTLPRGAPAYLPAGAALTDGGDWEFRWATVAPPGQPGEAEVDWVKDDDAVRSLLDLASPTASALPGDDAVRRWAGVWREDGLAACAADTSGVPGVGHISSVAVHPAHRRTGLGNAIAAWLTRQLLDECDVVTLGLYADNAAAMALYERLGFGSTHRFSSGVLQLARR